eukprot:UN23762
MWFGSICVAYLNQHDTFTATLLFMWIITIFEFFMFIFVGMLFVTQLYMITLNETTNEKSNWQRYQYMQRPPGNYYNKYDKTPYLNWW